MADVRTIDKYLRGTFGEDYNSDLLIKEGLEAALFTPKTRELGIEIKGNPTFGSVVISNIIGLNSFGESLEIPFSLKSRYLVVDGNPTKVDGSMILEIDHNPWPSTYYDKRIQDVVVNVGNRITQAISGNQHILKANSKFFTWDLAFGVNFGELFPNANLAVKVSEGPLSSYRIFNLAVQELVNSLSMFQLIAPQNDGKTQLDIIIDDILKKMVDTNIILSPDNVKFRDLHYNGGDKNLVTYTFSFEGKNGLYQGADLVVENVIPDGKNAFFQLKGSIDFVVNVNRPGFEESSSLLEYTINPISKIPGTKIIGNYYEAGPMR